MAARSLTPNAENCSRSELHTAMGAARSGRERDRMIAIRALLEGESIDTVARVFGRHRRTIKQWINRFNERGIDGLLDAPRSGAPPKIPQTMEGDLIDLVEHPEQAGEQHWTARKLHGYLNGELEIKVGYSTTCRWLRDRDFRLKVPQPWPDRQDEAARQAFVERVVALMEEPTVELWYGDETGIEGDPRPRRRWAKKGSKPRVTRNGDHLRINVVGMVCPRSGEFFALEVSHSDRECFQAFLDEANRCLKPSRQRNILIMDNASWHRCKELDWGRFEPLFLPPYSPDLNPIEQLWRILKAHWFADFIAKSYEALTARTDQALLWAINRLDDNKLTCKIKTEL
jgi:transposase